ncbi:leukosialin isoform X3 [Chelonia mydas]|uniref:leukosialin isoform X3 n=1 Tax=Chelonia mydas TaxID=8469 RepID=UPI001CA8BF4E|nr:leukosialin isoform X3 [Chelonia mydas]
MAVSGAWPQPKIPATLLLLLVAAACAETAPERKGNDSSATHETRQLETASPSAAFASHSPGLSAELASHSPGPSAELASHSPGPSAELASNGTGPSAKFAVHPLTTAQLITPTTPTLATEEPVGSVSPSALPAVEATVSSGPAGATAAGGEKSDMYLNREELKGQVGTVPGSPSPRQENQTVPGRSGQSKSAPTEPAKPEDADRGGHNRTVPASPDRTGHNRTVPASPDRTGHNRTVPASADRGGHNRTVPASPDRTIPASADPTGHNRTVPASPDRTIPASADPTGHPGEDQTTPKLSPSALPSTPPVKNQEPEFKALITTPAAPAPIPHPVPVGLVVPLVIVAVLLLALLLLVLHCRRQSRSGSTSFSTGRAGPSAWAGPVSLPEERGEGQAGDGGQPAGPGEARRPTLTTFFGKRHSRVSSVAMEDVARAKGEGPLSEPLLAAGEQGSEPATQGAGEANGTVPVMPGPPSPPPDPPANGEFPLPPPMEQEAMPPV